MKQLHMVLYGLAILAVTGLTMTGRAEPDGGRTLVLRLPEDPPQLDSTRTTDGLSFHVLGHCLEGLLTYGSDGRLEGGAASDWEVRDRSITFRIRADARWENDAPVTAHDFVFAWQTALDPATASRYASILYHLENAEAINRGDVHPDKLGAVATDDRTLEVTLARPVPYFSQLTAFVTYFPVNQAFYEKTNGRYGADQDAILCNGAFTVAEWTHGARLVLERNPHYWNRQAVGLDALDYRYFTNDMRTVFGLFRGGDVDVAPLDASTIDQATEAELEVRSYAAGTLFYLEFNHRASRPTRNTNLRLALQAVLDRNELVDVVGLPGVVPAGSLFPCWLRSLASPRHFCDDYPPPEIRHDADRGRRLLAKAMDELGLSEPPSLTLLAGDSATARREAEYYQRVFERELGVELVIDRQTFKERLAKMNAGDFDLAQAGWGPDFDHPATFGDLFASTNANNHGAYANAAYDDALRRALESTDPTEQMEAWAAIQDIVVNDAVVLLGYEGRGHYVQRRVTGVGRRPIGFSPDYRYARVAGED